MTFDLPKLTVRRCAFTGVAKSYSTASSPAWPTELCAGQRQREPLLLLARQPWRDAHPPEATTAQAQAAI